MKGWTNVADNISSATVVDIRGDDVLLDIWHGNTRAMGQREVKSAHVVHRPMVMVIEPNGDATVTRIDR